MNKKNIKSLIYLLIIPFSFAQNQSSDSLKEMVISKVESQSKLVHEMVDMIYSFGELGFLDVETSKYLIDVF